MPTAFIGCVCFIWGAITTILMITMSRVWCAVMKSDCSPVFTTRIATNTALFWSHITRNKTAGVGLWKIMTDSSREQWQVTGDTVLTNQDWGNSYQLATVSIVRETLGHLVRQGSTVSRVSLPHQWCRLETQKSNSPRCTDVPCTV